MSRTFETLISPPTANDEQLLVALGRLADRNPAFCTGDVDYTLITLTDAETLYDTDGDPEAALLVTHDFEATRTPVFRAGLREVMARHRTHQPAMRKIRRGLRKDEKMALYHASTAETIEFHLGLKVTQEAVEVPPAIMRRAWPGVAVDEAVEMIGQGAISHEIRFGIDTADRRLEYCEGFSYCDEDGDELGGVCSCDRPAYDQVIHEIADFNRIVAVDPDLLLDPDRPGLVALVPEPIRQTDPLQAVRDWSAFLQMVRNNNLDEALRPSHQQLCTQAASILNGLHQKLQAYHGPVQ